MIDYKKEFLKLRDLIKEKRELLIEDVESVPKDNKDRPWLLWFKGQRTMCSYILDVMNEVVAKDTDCLKAITSVEDLDNITEEQQRALAQRIHESFSAPSAKEELEDLMKRADEAGKRFERETKMTQEMRNRKIGK